MAQQPINTGTVANDGTGQTLRSAFVKVNQNFTELYGSLAGQTEALANSIVQRDANGNIYATGLTFRNNFGSVGAFPTANSTNYGTVVYSTGDDAEYYSNGIGWVKLLDIRSGNATVPGNLIVTTQLTAVSTNITGSANVANLGTGNAVITANATFGNINSVSGILSVTGNANVGNIGAVNANLSALTVSGNINSGNIFIANGSNISGTVGGFAVGYRDQPPMAGGNIILAATDAGKHYYSTTDTFQTLTIPSQANVPMPVGTVIRVIHNNAAGFVTIQPQSPVTLKLALLGYTGGRLVGSYGDATITKIESDVWWISGTSVS